MLMKEYKVVHFGAGGVGNSTLMVRFVAGEFDEKCSQPIEEYYCKEIDVDGSLGVIQNP